MTESWRYTTRPILGSSLLPVDTPRITTMLTADEQLRVDAVGLGAFHSFHRESADDVARDLRNRNARTLLISTAFCRYTDMTSVARVVREFPRVPAVALLSQFDGGTARAVLTLGQCGVRTLVDVREPGGWRELRAVLLSQRANDIQRVAVAQLILDLGHAPQGARRFVEALFTVAPKTATIRHLAQAVNVVPSTLMSRFYRAKLPPPKKFLVYARLTYAARLFENPGLSIASVANQLDYSSPQSFSRHVRTVLGISAMYFRARYDGEGMLQYFRDELILRLHDQWRVFDPLCSQAVERKQKARLCRTSLTSSRE